MSVIAFPFRPVFVNSDVFTVFPNYIRVISLRPTAWIFRRLPHTLPDQYGCYSLYRVGKKNARRGVKKREKKESKKSKRRKGEGNGRGRKTSPRPIHISGYATDLATAVAAAWRVTSHQIMPSSPLKVKGQRLSIDFHGKPIAELRIVTCHMWSHSVTCMPAGTGKRVPPQPQPDRPVLDLPTPEGWRAELTLVLVIHLNGLPARSYSWRKFLQRCSVAKTNNRPDLGADQNHSPIPMWRW